MREPNQFSVNKLGGQGTVSNTLSEIDGKEGGEGKGKRSSERNRETERASER